MISEYSETSEFNSAIQFLNRCGHWFWMADLAIEQSSAHAWFKALNILFLELRYYMKPSTADTKAKQQLHDINNLLNKQMNRQHQTQQTSNLIPPDLYDLLFEFHCLMKKTFKEAGLELKMQNSASAALR